MCDYAVWLRISLHIYAFIRQLKCLTNNNVHIILPIHENIIGEIIMIDVHSQEQQTVVDKCF